MITISVLLFSLICGICAGIGCVAGMLYNNKRNN